MNNKKLYYILKSVWMVVVLIVALIFMNRDHTDISANKEEEATRLNIALVNEDVGVTRNGRAYSLGVDYVKKIEKDTDHNWFTVTRGIGESGLKNGTYNLLITIPSTFSEKLLELDSSSPEKLQINYKINANGNSTLENESRSVGRSIVSGLNQQLVDMYVVSIIDNLFTAQRNIEKVYTNQTESVGNFQDVLYQPTINFKDYLPALTSQSNSALQSNDLLTSLLSSFSDSTVSLLDSHKDYSTILEELLQQRAEGKLTYEEFLEILLTLDSSILSSETNNLMTSINSANEYFVQQFSSQEEGLYFQQTDIINKYTDSKTQITAMQTQLTELNDAYFEKYEKKFYEAMGVELIEGEPAPGITLEDVLNKQMGSTSAGQYFSSIADFNTNYTDKMQERLNLLPLRDTTESGVTDIFEYKNIPYWDAKKEKWIAPPLDTTAELIKDVRGKVGSINTAIKAQNLAYYGEELPETGVPILEFPSTNTVTDTDGNDIDEKNVTKGLYYNELSNAYEALVKEREKISKKKYAISIKWKNVGYKAKIVVPETEGVELDTVNSKGATYAGPSSSGHVYNVSKSSSDRDEKTIEIYYNYTDSYNEAEMKPINVKISQDKTDSGGNTITNFKAKQGESNTIVIEPMTSISEESLESSSSEEDIEEDEEHPITSDEANVNDTEYSDLPSLDDGFDTSETIPEKQIAPKDSGTENQEGYSVVVSYNLDATGFLSVDYQTAKRNYSEKIGEIIELYKSVYDELTVYESYPFVTFHTFQDMDLTDVFKTAINGTFLGYSSEQEVVLSNLLEKAAEIESANGAIQESLIETQTNTTALNASVTEQMELLNTWQETSQSLTASESLVSAMNAQTDSEVTSVYETLKIILSQSEMVKESSQQNVEQADGVKTIFDSFNNEVKNAQQNSEELSENADQIMEELNTELANNSNFVDAFVKVLNNAYQDGVPNNSLLQFIANPVTGNAEATIQTTEVNQPFTWILIMFTLSLFLAYLFATQPVVRKIKDKFKREQLWFKDNIMETILLSTSAVVVGLILALLSIGELAITKESQIVWIMMVLIFMLIFSLMNHYALKQFHIAGFALSLFLFVSYVFVTNAIGKTKENNPLVGFIRQVNPLSIGEHNLADILSNNALDIVKILLYLLIIAGLVAFNIFIWKPRKKAREVAKK
ncbi:type VII secretion protein EsaA [uncultured Enterococcus sp.]|uniref:type VII secretion protein EsaA n=1 Tax=uncultured Enterococcus sp. TaxID=167972 RepID=UPI002AA89BFE|nr:type VII secretion protein EsaA [uncultured Enterococcus sp.]